MTTFMWPLLMYIITEGAISNPNNSEDARERAKQRIDDMYEKGEVDSAEAHAGQVERGHKVGTISRTISVEVC